MGDPRQLRLLLVDDHPVVRRGLRAVFTDPAALSEVSQQLDSVQVVAEAGDGVEALEILATIGVDVVLMDLQMPRLDGVSTTARIRALPDPPAVLILTTFDSDDDIVAAMDAGAAGYLLKDAPGASIISAAYRAARGRPALDGSIAARLASRRDAPAQAMTQRELELLKLMATGATNRELARTLFISEATVKTHLLHIYNKLSVDNRTAAVKVARERHILR